jgi:hypothetical protein
MLGQAKRKMLRYSGKVCVWGRQRMYILCREISCKVVTWKIEKEMDF